MLPLVKAGEGSKVGLSAFRCYILVCRWAFLQTLIGHGRCIGLRTWEDSGYYCTS